MIDIGPHAQWLYEDGIGEARAALVTGGRIVEAVVERHGNGALAGAVLPGRLVRTIVPRRRGLARLDGGEEILVEPIPPKVAEGSPVFIEIVREGIGEPGLDGVRAKRALGRIAGPGARSVPGPTLPERLAASAIPVRPCAGHEPDILDACGWGALMEEATTGAVVREDAALRIFPTPAMTLIDIDGVAPPAQLGPKGAKLAAQAIRRMGITGSIGIDLPTMNNREERLVAAAQIDKYLPQPFERTAVNGFGFVQIIRRRTRPSLIETLREDPVLTAALAGLRLAERHGGSIGAVNLSIPASVAACLRRNPDWLRTLERRRGGAVDIVIDDNLGQGVAHAA